MEAAAPLSLSLLDGRAEARLLLGRPGKKRMINSGPCLAAYEGERGGGEGNNNRWRENGREKIEKPRRKIRKKGKKVRQ